MSTTRIRVLPEGGPSRPVHWDHGLRLYEKYWDLDQEDDRSPLFDLGYVGTALWDVDTDLVSHVEAVGVDSSLTEDLRMRGYTVQVFEATYLKMRPLTVIDRGGSHGRTRSVYFFGTTEELSKRLDILDVMES